MIGRVCLFVLRDGCAVSSGSFESHFSEYSAFVHLCFSGVLLHLNFLVNVEHLQIPDGPASCQQSRIPIWPPRKPPAP